MLPKYAERKLKTRLNVMTDKLLKLILDALVVVTSTVHIAR